MPSECFTGATEAADAPGATDASGASDAVDASASSASSTTSAAVTSDDDDDDDDDISAGAHPLPSAAVALAASVEASATPGRGAVAGAASAVTCEAARREEPVRALVRASRCHASSEAATSVRSAVVSTRPSRERARASGAGAKEAKAMGAGALSATGDPRWASPCSSCRHCCISLSEAGAAPAAAAVSAPTADVSAMPGLAPVPCGGGGSVGKRNGCTGKGKDERGDEVGGGASTEGGG